MKRLIMRLLASLLTCAIGLLAYSAVAHKPAEPAPVPTETITATAPVFTASLPLPLPAFKATTQVISDYDPNVFQPDGDFVLSGKAPAGFKGVGSLHIYSGKVELMANSEGVDFGPVTYAFINEERLIFATKSTEAGVELKFDGQFLQKGMLRELADTRPVIAGKLTKYKGNKKLAEATVKFKIYLATC